MTPDRWNQINDALDAVLTRPPAERGAYLDRYYGDDPALRDKVLQLAAVYEGDDSFLEQPIADFVAPLLPAAQAGALPQPERRVGPYRLLRPIARGGMGTVYLAQRDDEHFRKQVALKLIRPGLDTEDVLRRFRHERQILARLEHSHIARLLDGGRADDDRPYFVMEYVDGQALTTYCDAHRLAIEARLRLFLDVCEAVRYAHRMLVVHRDLKPSNILVTDDGVVKLLDFGIAKLLEDDEAGEAPLTRTGMHVMTPEYAAPEQITGEAVTTTTDVYALGVLLYELLTGRRPYPVEGRSKTEIERIILETEPTRPSAIVTTLPSNQPTEASSETLSQARATTAAVLRRQLAGDLDTIVLKALRKEPDRRYASVDAFADDVQRYLDGLPVHARPDTLWYRTGKFVRRNRWGVVAAAVFLLLLASYAATTRVQAQRIGVERDKAEQVAAFLADVLKRADPFETADNLTVRDVLDRASARIESDLSAQPEVQAELRHLMSGVYQNLGLYDAALPHSQESLALRQATLGGAHPDVATSLNDLADVFCYLGDYTTSDSLYRKALSLRRDLFGEASEPYAETLTDWGLLLYYQGEQMECLKHLRRALDLNRQVHGFEHPRVGESLHTLGAVYWAVSSQDSTRKVHHRDTAEVLVRESLAVRRAVFPPDHPEIVHSLSFLADILRATGRLDEAEPLFEEALALHRQRLGDEHPYVATRLLGLARLRQDQRRYAEADSLATQAVDLRRRRLGVDHPETLRAEREREALRLGRPDDASDL